MGVVVVYEHPRKLLSIACMIVLGWYNAGTEEGRVFGVVAESVETGAKLLAEELRLKPLLLARGWSSPKE